MSDSISSKIGHRLSLNLGQLLELWAAGVSLAALGIVVWGFWRGIDLTDEGYALNWMEWPFLYKASVSQFGFLLHPIYLIVGGDIIFLRLAGVVLLTAAATAFVLSLFRLPVLNPDLPQKNQFLLVIAGSSAVLLYYIEWIPTPNYNLLNLCGVLLALSGWFQIIRVMEEKGLGRWHRPVAVTICALGFAITALVKPPTAAVLSVLVTLLTLAFGRRAVLDILVAGFLSCLLVVLVLVAIDGDLSAVITRYRNDLYAIEIFHGHHDFTYLLHFDLPFGSRDWMYLLLMAALGPIVSITLSINRWAPARMLVCALVLTFQFILLRPLLNSVVAHLAIGVLILTGISTTWLLTRWRTPSDRTDWRYIAVVLATIFAPIAFSFGTDNLIWPKAAHAGVFWTCAIALLTNLAPRTMRLSWLRFTMAASACLVVQALLNAIKSPYRLPGPLWEQTEWISSSTKERVVKGDPITASYFRTLLSGARAAGFQVGTPVIDMTGTAPTTVHLLGAEPLGLAWMIGGKSGSRDLAFHALSEISADKLGRSWILTALDGHRSLPLDLLAAVGLQFPNEYEEVARAKTGYRNEVHVLWRPLKAKTALPGVRGAQLSFTPRKE